MLQRMKVVRSQWRKLSLGMRFKKQNKKQMFNVYEHFSTIVEKTTSMLQQFIKTNVLLRNMDAQIGCLMDKL
jgi:enamine deaminase RidA (YjgF/YER057c/UK114 family)